MTTITLNANLDTQVRSIAQQARASVDEIVNDILARYITHYRDEKVVLSGREKNKQLIEQLAGIGEGDADGSTNYKQYVSGYLDEKFGHC
jgi:hypothetical protein